MSYTDILKIYSFDDYSCECVHNDKYSIDGHKIMIKLYKDSRLISVENKETIWILNKPVAHLDYIGFDENFRHDGNLRKIHKNCISVLKASSSISKVTLKPLTHVVTLWLYLGFEFVKETEKDNFILTLINWIDDNNIEYNIKNIENDIMPYTIKNLKEYLLQYDFPSAIKQYISTLYKDVT